MFNFLYAAKSRSLFKNEYFSIELLSTFDPVFRKFQNWSKNRPPDQSRVDEIYEYYKLHNSSIIDGILYVWNDGEDNYYIYDGLHRYEAAMMNDREMHAMICFYETKKEADIINHFITINKSINVPCLYMEDSNYYKRRLCEDIAKEYARKYPEFLSNSIKPHVPNFNRDNFIDLLATLNIDFKKSDAIEKVLDILAELNQLMKEKKKFAKQKPKKCNTSDFYLFFLDNLSIKKYIEEKFSVEN